jgi:hypothetical protein
MHCTAFSFITHLGLLFPYSNHGLLPWLLVVVGSALIPPWAVGSAAPGATQTW